jgi:hypothetical protein
MENFVLSSIGIFIVPLYSIYSSGSWKSFKYGCYNAYYAVYRWLGLNVNKCWSKFKAYGSILPKNVLNDFFLPIVIWFMHYDAINDWIDSISYLVGLPINYSIIYIWFNVELPGKMAFPVYISPSMQPTDHISTALV